MMKSIILLSVLIASITCAQAQERLQISLFTESLCPYCIQVLTTSVANAVNAPGFFDMVDFQIYPYGNAREIQLGSNWTFTCQHGPNECYGNSLENCAKVYYSPADFWNWLICVEAGVESTGNFDISGLTCSQQLNLDFNTVQNCAGDSQGNALVHDAALITENLNEPHTYVPWIVVNGDHNEVDEEDIFDSLLKFVCNNYQGTKSSACSSSILTI